MAMTSSPLLSVYSSMLLSVSRFAETLFGLFSVFHRSFRTFWEFLRPEGMNDPSSSSLTPRSMIPPYVLANAEYASHRESGRPLAAFLASMVLFSLYALYLLISNPMHI